MKKNFSILDHKPEFTDLADGIAEFTQWYVNDFLMPVR